jgi:hypothetical protein
MKNNTLLIYPLSLAIHLIPTVQHTTHYSYITTYKQNTRTSMLLDPLAGPGWIAVFNV